MKVKSIPCSWLREEGHRLSATPHMSEARAAKQTLETLSIEKHYLSALTRGGTKGILNGPRFARRYVESPEYGVPLLSGSTILQTDISDAPLISKKQAKSMPEIILEEGTTLITSYGTVGRLAYARKDMEGSVGSDNVMKVYPNRNLISPGYLYAFLSSRFGIPIVTVGTSGGTVPFLSPERVYRIPIPRFSKRIEQRVHDLVQEAADLRVAASTTISNEAGKFDQVIKDIEHERQSPYINYVSSSTIQERFDAQYHDPIVAKIRLKISGQKHASIGDFCSKIFLPGIFKRIHIDDPRFGAPYFTGASIFCLEPQAKGILSKNTSLFDQVLLEKGTILVQAFGQDGGLTGRSAWVGNHLDGCTTTHMLVRLNAKDPELAGYLFAFLQSEAGYRQIACLTYGGSIPHLDENGIATVVIPLMPEDEMRQISKTVIQALDDRDEALSLELEARKLVEKAIEEAA